MARKNEVKQGDVWTLRLTTGRLVEVMVLGPGPYSPRHYGPVGFKVQQQDSGREFTIRSAGKLRSLVRRPGFEVSYDEYENLYLERKDD